MVELTISQGGDGAEAEALRRGRDRRENTPGGGKTTWGLPGTGHLATQATWAGEDRYLLGGATARDPDLPRQAHDEVFTARGGELITCGQIAFAPTGAPHKFVKAQRHVTLPSH